jgi:hypothetical protein
MTTSMPLAASSSTSTRASTSRASSWASARSNPTPRSRRWMTRARSSSTTPRYTRWPRSCRCRRSRRWPAPRSTASTRQPRARSPTPVTYTPTRTPKTKRCEHPLPTSGPCARTRCGPRPRRSSGRSAWSSRSSDTTSSVSLALCPFGLPFCALTLVYSPRARREAQAGEEREDASVHGTRPEATKTQQRLDRDRIQVWKEAETWMQCIDCSGGEDFNWVPSGRGEASFIQLDRPRRGSSVCTIAVTATGVTGVHFIVLR